MKLPERLVSRAAQVVEVDVVLADVSVLFEVERRGHGLDHHDGAADVESEDGVGSVHCGVRSGGEREHLDLYVGDSFVEVREVAQLFGQHGRPAHGPAQRGFVEYAPDLAADSRGSVRQHAACAVRRTS
nr:hypothetical protein [Streptomyces sp. 2112.3]